MGDTTMPSTLASSLSGHSNTYEQEESSLSLLSRRVSSFFESSRYIELDEGGIYLSSLAVTVLVSAILTIGILLFTLVITLAILLASCQNKPNVVVKGSQVLETANMCRSLTLNFELNNIQLSNMFSSVCREYLLKYMKDGQYEKDVHGAIMAAEAYWTEMVPNDDGLDAVIMDIDETALSNAPYYISVLESSRRHNDSDWLRWIEEGESPALIPTLKLYQKVQVKGFSLIFLTSRLENTRNFTEKNLISVGYSAWRLLIMRPEHYEQDIQTFKSEKRMQLEDLGFRIQGVIGDQWSDIRGPCVGNFTFKIPNPLYHSI